MDAANGRESLVEQTKPSGMGILSLCYVCEDVAMEYHPEHGNGLHATYRIELDELRFTRPLAIE